MRMGDYLKEAAKDLETLTFSGVLYIRRVILLGGGGSQRLERRDANKVCSKIPSVKKRGTRVCPEIYSDGSLSDDR